MVDSTVTPTTYSWRLERDRSMQIIPCLSLGTWGPQCHMTQHEMWWPTPNALAYMLAGLQCHVSYLSITSEQAPLQETAVHHDFNWTEAPIQTRYVVPNFTLCTAVPVHTSTTCISSTQYIPIHGSARKTKPIHGALIDQNCYCWLQSWCNTIRIPLLSYPFQFVVSCI